MKKLYCVRVLSETLVMIVPPVLVFTLFMNIKSTEAGPQTAVYVRFLSPPHGYSHGLEVHYPGANPIAKEERLYLPPANQQNQQQNNYHHYQQHNQHHHHGNEQTQANLHHHGQQQQQQYDSGVQVDYHYPRPDRVFHELGERFISSFPHGRALPELLFPVGLFQGPSSAADFQREHPGAKFDPLLLTGSLAQRIVSMVMNHGILYFSEIPHEPLVLGNNLERIQNNLIPHRLGSIRPGHPFFNFNK